MSWKIVDFGKHEGKSLPQIAFIDPDYLFWGVERDVFHEDPMLALQARTVAGRAQRILIPDNSVMNKSVRYMVDRRRGKLDAVLLIDMHKGAEMGYSHPNDQRHFDLSYARRLCAYDKHGAKLIVRAIKRDVFGDPRTYLKKKLVERFFDDETNFAMARR